MQERHWLGKGMLGAFSLAITVGVSYLLNQSVAVALVLWGVLGTLTVVSAERLHLNVSAPLDALDQRFGSIRLVRTAVAGPDVVVEATSGPSPEIRLGVTNRGASATFRGTAKIVAKRNDPNDPRQGTYSLRWVELESSSITLDRWQHGGLLIARFDLSMQPQVRMGAATLMEWTSAGPREWSGFRWVLDPKDPALPEIDLDVTITSTVAKAPLVLRYTVRPAAWIGPLELVARGTTTS